MKQAKRCGRAMLALIAAVAFNARLVQAQGASEGARDLFVTAGKSLVVESPVIIQRVAVGDSKIAEAVAVSPREVLINGKLPGETSLIVWQQGGNRLLFDLRVRQGTLSLDAVREELKKEVPEADVTFAVNEGNVFVRGTVPDMLVADRVMSIATTLGKPVNLLNVKVPAMEQQVLLKVKFANVDRAVSRDLGVNLFSTGATNTIGSTSTQQFQQPQLNFDGRAAEVSLSDALNIFLFRPDLNLGATIRALQTRRLLEILAEPNVLAMNGREAAFLAGGEFPVPVIQSGVGGAGTVTIQWREFGIRINFTPVMTPRGTIRLKVAPEVSSLDYANAVTISGFTVPALSTRRVNTEIELEAGQSFAIAGLLDNRVVDNLSKIPGLGDIPLIGKLFQSKSISKNSTELLVVVTPELVRPAPADKPVPDIKFPQPFLEGGPTVAPRTPGLAVTGAAEKEVIKTVPYEQLQQIQEQMKDQPAAPQMPIMQLVPMPAPAQQPNAPVQGASAPAAAASPGTPR
ncbi:MAG TPA: type II and III secretion system protein family protein [Bryobacteraceae bacterium]|nr:type II and III secretion system protein family protein [Bryobacteraceae bacterium]